MIVVLSTPKKFYLASWLIKKATNFQASHASIHVEGRGTLKDCSIVLEATTRGVGTIPGGWWCAKNEVVLAYRLVREVEAGAEAYREIWKEANVPYDFMGIYRFAIRLLLRWFFNLNIRCSPDTPKRMFCSELVARWLMRLSEKIAKDGREPLRIAPELMAPGDLIGLMMGLGVFEEVPCGSLSSATSI